MLVKVDISENELVEIITKIKTIYGYDFSNYSANSLKRRISRYLILHNISFENLVFKLNSENSFFTAFLDEITVNVTEFFRDHVQLIFLKEKILPLLDSYPVIRVWYAGCATGEMVYSLAILLKEAGLLHKTLIYATDISQRSLKIAKTGKYAVEAIQNFETNYIKTGGLTMPQCYYIKNENYFYFNNELRERIVFSHHNLAIDQSFNEFNLILCQNVMIYFNKNLQNNVLELLTHSLTQLGFLMLGNKESIEFADVANQYETISSKEKAYRKLITEAKSANKRKIMNG